jgi:hypothetical protein
MAGFGSLSLTQTAIGTLIDQRAVVLYKQPEIDTSLSKYKVVNKILSDIWGGSLQYEELFSGLISDINSDILNKAVNITGTNPYGITYISATVDVESDLCEHPIETGGTVTDASIIKPVSARVEVAMPTFFAEKIYNSMDELQKKKIGRIILQTKYHVYKNLVLQNFSYALDNNKVDRTIFTLSLREIMEVQPYGDFDFLASKPENVADASDVNTISNGTQVGGSNV